jgi:diguanylate cyclase (GGDEF)-like protein
MKVLSAEDGPHFAILDWMMPGMDGVTVCREIRKRPGHYIYIILLTALTASADVVAGLDSGADDFLSKPFNAGELRARLRSGARVLDLQSGLLETQRALHKAATCDDLTGLWNRRMILDQLERELNRTVHEQQPLAVAIADIDLFKRINDSYGHAAGDLVLCDVSSALRLELRNYDFIGRYGGEEFLVLLAGCDTPTGIITAERICRAIAANPIAIRDVKVSITLSIGLTSTSDVGFDPATLIAAADAALYRAKAGGRNRVA